MIIYDKCLCISTCMLHFIGITIIPTDILELLFFPDTLLPLSGSQVEPKI